MVPLYGHEVAMPSEVVDRLKEILPPDAFAPVLDPNLPMLEEYEPASPSRPMLRVLDGDEPIDPEPLPPAA